MAVERVADMQAVEGTARGVEKERRSVGAQI